MFRPRRLGDEYVHSGYVLYDQLLYFQAQREISALHRHLYQSAHHKLDDRVTRLKHLIRRTTGSQMATKRRTMSTTKCSTKKATRQRRIAKAPIGCRSFRLLDTGIVSMPWPMRFHLFGLADADNARSR